MSAATNVHVVQLPFPSMDEPHEWVRDYYRDYAAVFARTFEDYFIPEAALWELPLWVAHMCGMLEHIGLNPIFSDLSALPSTTEACAGSLLERSSPGATFLMSPLAQNFDLAVSVSKCLMAAGRVTCLGGNMAPLMQGGDATVIHHGQATPMSIQKALAGNADVLSNFLKRRDVVDWLPSYKPLEGYAGRVPLLRLNASHGCLYACEFCGDAWSRKLALVPRRTLEYEVSEFQRLFPQTRLIYIGDKTFGQSPEAVENLLAVFAGNRAYKFIVQTHVLALNEEVLDAMETLGVVAVELGFESASMDLLKLNRKNHRSLEFYAERIRALRGRGIRVVLNLLSGLPNEAARNHRETLDFLENYAADSWLYNLYNFVPYPLTPLFPSLRPRIVDWSYKNWREDGLPVFEPYECSREESFGFFLEKVRAAHKLVRRALPASPARQLLGAAGQREQEILVAS